jgi:hypothetical protein
MNSKMKPKKLRFALYTYDLWANDEGGMVVNDVYYQGEVEVKARLNPKTETYRITDRQLNRAINARGLSWDGDDDYTLYATDRKGNPACELRRVK